MWCFGKKRNKAQQRYLQGGIGVLISYFGFFFSTFTAVHRFHPTGWKLVLAAALPSIPIFFFLYIVGRYLREETDEYQRDTFIRCILWGIAFVMAVEMFTSFLRIFGWSGHLPPFTQYYVFCFSILISKLVYKYKNRVVGDE